MIRIYALVEGQSEESVINNVIAPSLANLQIYLTPTALPTSKGHKGGDVSFDRLFFNLRNFLNQEKDTYITTFLDFYKLKTDFPNYNHAMQHNDIYQKIDVLENALHLEVINNLKCRPERFIPNIQPHELEALFFSDVEKFPNVETRWQAYLPKLQSVYDEFNTPEHINNSPQTAPSKRLEAILTPDYRKNRHAPLLAKEIGLHKIESEYQHFHAWLEKIRQLKPL